MASRRDLIKMSDEEAWAFLAEQRFGVLGTTGSDGAPHMVNVGYLVEDGRIVLTSFASAQKVRNLERHPTASFLVEVPWPYHQIRGVLATGPVTLDHDTERVVAITTLMRREHSAQDRAPDDAPEIDIARHAVKRVAVTIEPARLRSWDHTKLDGKY
jgi:PPOX class probable F420-dependent enzyme